MIFIGLLFKLTRFSRTEGAYAILGRLQYWRYLIDYRSLAAEAQDIPDKYLARTSTIADNAIAKFENVLETDFAKRSGKQVRKNHVARPET